MLRERCPVVFAFDDAYVVPALVAMYSARSSSSKDLSFLVAIEENSLQHSSMELIQDFCDHVGISLSFVSVSVPRSLYTSGHITRSAYLRLFLPMHLKTPFLYLDADLILSKGWDKLLDIPGNYSEFGVYGVVDIGASGLLDSNQAKIVSRGRYINSGVLVVIPQRLEIDYQEKVFSAIEEYSKLGFQWHDQCVLNFVMEGRVGLISKDYNSQFPKDSLMMLKRPVLHFTGSQKPWNATKERHRAFGVRKWRGAYKKLLWAVRRNEDLRIRVKDAGDAFSLDR